MLQLSCLLMNHTTGSKGQVLVSRHKDNACKPTVQAHRPEFERVWSPREHRQLCVE